MLWPNAKVPAACTSWEGVWCPIATAWIIASLWESEASSLGLLAKCVATAAMRCESAMVGCNQVSVTKPKSLRVTCFLCNAIEYVSG